MRGTHTRRRMHAGRRLATSGCGMQGGRGPRRHAPGSRLGEKAVLEVASIAEKCKEFGIMEVASPTFRLQASQEAPRMARAGCANARGAAFRYVPRAPPDRLRGMRGLQQGRIAGPCANPPIPPRVRSQDMAASQGARPPFRPSSCSRRTSRKSQPRHGKDLGAGESSEPLLQGREHGPCCAGDMP